MNARLNALVAPAISLLLVLSPTTHLRAQSGPEEANRAAYDLFLGGNYEQAAAAYEKVLADYSTSAIVPAAQLQLASSYFYLGEYDKALATLDALLSGPPPSPAVNQAARSLQPQILSAQASAMDPDNTGRKAAFEQAIAKYTEFLTQFPGTPETESVRYGRALANFQIANYDEAIKDLEENVAQFGASSTIASSRNLLALAYASKGSADLNAGTSVDRSAAFGLYDKAIAALREIVNRRSDLTLINDAHFQIGEILFNRAAFSDEEDRAALYQQALEAYRSIEPREMIVARQRERLAGFPALRRQAIQAQDRQALDRIERDNEREVKRLAELEARPDQTTNAMLKMAEIFVNSNQPNAARVLVTHLEPFLDADAEKKRAQYLKTMTYALQGAAPQAVAAYDQFQAAFKGDAIAENLPITLGNMFLSSPDPAVADPQKAATYFEESLTLYPDGRLAGLSVVNRAAALSKLGQTDEALKTFTDFLAKNPRPEEAAAAQMGIAALYKDTGKWDEAITAYREVLTAHADQPQAVDAEFWIAFSTQQKGDAAAAIPLFESFIKSHADSPLVPTALYSLATAQLATGNQTAGVATLADIAERFPDSPPAPFTYFQRAQIVGAEGKKDEMLGLMRAFIEKYPQDDKVFFAYDSIAQTATNDGRPDDAITTYTEYAEKYAATPRTPEALLKIATLQRGKAESLGRYVAMPPEDQAVWRKNLDEGIATAESIVQKFPDSPQAALALGSLLDSQRLLAGAGLKSPAEVEEYFETLAAAAPSPAARSKTLFTLATFLSESDRVRALATMQAAYDPAVVFAPADLDFYATALLDDGKTDEAAVIFDKVAADYAIPPGVAAQQAPPQIQEAQAVALFGKGRIAQLKGDTATAGQLFEELKATYPWSPKVLEANFGIAQSLEAEKKYDEALALLTQIIRAPTATADLRAGSMLLGGRIMEEKGDLEAAIDYNIKIAQFYAGVPAAAAEGLWRGGQLLEKQAATLTDAAAKTRQLSQARRAYQDITTNYPASEFASQATERLGALGQ